MAHTTKEYPKPVLRYLGDMVGVELLPSDKMVGALHLPESHIQLTRNGIIRYVGTGIKSHLKPYLKEGTQVIVNLYDSAEYGASKTTLGGKEIRNFPSESIIAVYDLSTEQ